MACTSEWYTQFPASPSHRAIRHSACFAALVTLHLMRHVAMLRREGLVDDDATALQLLLLVPAPIALFIASTASTTIGIIRPMWLRVRLSGRASPR